MLRNVLRRSLPAVLAVLAIEVSGAYAQDSLAARDSSFTLEIEVRNRVYPDWREEWRVRLGETFYLGDSKYTARVERFVPDFRINDKGEVLSFSDHLNNPAAQIIVYGDSAATDTTWAFMNFPPHYSPRSFFAFRLKAVDGADPPTADNVDPAARSESSTKARREEHDG